MNPFYLKNRHLFEDEREVPYQISTDKLRNLGPKLLTEPRVIRDFSKERESPSLAGPLNNVFSQNAKSLLTNNPYNDPVVPSLEKENQMSRRDSYSNLLSNYQSLNPSYQSPEPKFNNPYNPLTLQEPFKPDLYSFPKISDYKSVPSVNKIKPALKSNQLPATLDLYNPVVHSGSPLDNSKQTGGVSSRGKPPISRGNYQEPIRANIMPPLHSVNRSDYESSATKERNPKDIASYTMELLKGNLNNNPNKNHIPTSLQSKITERYSSQTEQIPSYSSQNYPITSNLQAKIQERYSSNLPSSQADQPEVRRSVGIKRDPVEEELQKQILQQREIEKEDRQRYNEYPDHVSPQPKESGKLKLKESIKESVKHNAFPMNAYMMMKKKMFNMRGDYNTLDSTPFLREKAILVSHLQMRADQLQALGNHKTVQEALERRLIASVKTDRKEKLRELLRSEGAIV